MVTIEAETLCLVHSKLNENIDSRFVRGAQTDSSGNLWITTNVGLYRADPTGKWAQKLTAREGIIDIDFEYEGPHFNQTKEKILVVGDKLNYLIDARAYNEILDGYLEKLTAVVISKITNFSGTGEDSGYRAQLEQTDTGSRCHRQCKTDPLTTI